MSSYLNYILPELKLIIFDKLVYLTTNIEYIFVDIESIGPTQEIEISFLDDYEGYLKEIDINLNDYIKYKYGSTIIYNSVKILDEEYKIALIIYMRYFNLEYPFTIIKEFEEMSKYTDVLINILIQINETNIQYREGYYQRFDLYLSNVLFYIENLVLSNIESIRRWAIKSLIIFYINYENGINLFISGYNDYTIEDEPEYLNTIKDIVWINKKMYQIFNENIINDKLLNTYIILKFTKNGNDIIMKYNIHNKEYTHDILIEDLISMIMIMLNKHDVENEIVSLSGGRNSKLFNLES
jgi:hypothetical protein